LDFETYRALQDASAAMRFIVHFADNLNIDTNYLYIDGHSAGSIVSHKALLYESTGIKSRYA
jgi:prepilin-type processing-associated H-X9-DG protein